MSPTNKRILVVESNDCARTVLVELLGSFGYLVHAVQLVSEGARLVKSQKFFWIICNERNTDGSGIAFLEEVRILQPETNLMLMSGAGDPGGHDVHFVPKPFDVKGFKFLLESVCEPAALR